MKKLLIITTLLLTACQQSTAPKPRTEPIAAAPNMTKYVMDDGTMLVVNVPASSIPHGTEFQTCFIWRDTSGSAMQCPNDRQSYTLDPPER